MYCRIKSWKKKSENLTLTARPFFSHVQVPSEGASSHNHWLTPDEADRMADALKAAAAQARKAKA